MCSECCSTLGSPPGSTQTDTWRGACSSLTAEAAKYKFSSDGSSYPQGYALGHFLVNALTKCKDPCAPADFEAAADSLGSFDLPNGVALGSLRVSSSRHYLLTKVGWFTYDSAKQTVTLIDTVDVADAQ